MSEDIEATDRITIGYVLNSQRAILAPDPAEFRNGLAIGADDWVVVGDRDVQVLRTDYDLKTMRFGPETFNRIPFRTPVYWFPRHGLTWQLRYDEQVKRNVKFRSHAFEIGAWTDTVCGLLKANPTAVLDPPKGQRRRLLWREVNATKLEAPEEYADRCPGCRGVAGMPAPWDES